MRALLLPVLAAATAALGFAVGRFAGSDAAPWRERSTASGPSAVPAAGMKPAPLPAVDFTDAPGFTAYVAGLKKLGLPEDLAKWLAISATVRGDLPGSLALAKANHATREWAAAVALTDPEAGFAFVRSLHDGNDVLGEMGSVGALGAFFQTLGRNNPALGLKLLGQISGPKGAKAAEALLESWASDDFAAAMEASAKLSPPGLREGALRGLFREWGRRDRHEMMRWASEQGRDVARIAFRSQFDMSGRMDPKELMDISRDFPEAVDPMILFNVVGGLASQGAKGFEAIADFPPGKLRDGMIWAFSSHLAESDPESAWKLAESLPPEDKKAFLDWSVCRSLAKVVPREIADIMLTTDLSDVSDMSDVIGIWAQKDPRAALQWSSQNLHGTRLAGSLRTALDQWVQTDPTAATAALSGLDAGLRAKLLPDLFSAWAEKDPPAALASAGALSPIDRPRAAEAVIKGWAFSDPIAAAKALAALPPSGMDGAYNTLSWRFAAKDPDAGMTWVEGLSNRNLQGSLARNITGEWGKNDAEAASKRVNELKPGLLRDHATAGLVDSIGELDPESAADWANSIGQADLRHDNLRKVLASWKDKAAAGAFVQKLEPQSLKAEMLGLVNGR